MKKRLTYFGNYILTCGTPYILINAWEDQQKYYSEIFVVFEKYDSTVITVGRRINVDKVLFVNLDDFIEKFAMNNAENIIFYEIIVQKICLPENKQIPNVQLKLNLSSDISWLSFINRKFGNTLLWIKSNSSNIDLNNSIDMIKSVQIDISDF